MNAIRKLITSILWDIADIIDYFASEIVCPRGAFEIDRDGDDNPPPPQYPVGTVIWGGGDSMKAWKVESSGEWSRVANNINLDDIADAYEGLYAEDDEDDAW